MIQPLTEEEIQALLAVCDPADEFGGEGPENALHAYIDGFRGKRRDPLFLTISRCPGPR